MCIVTVSKNWDTISECLVSSSPYHRCKCGVNYTCWIKMHGLIEKGKRSVLNFLCLLASVPELHGKQSWHRTGMDQRHFLVSWHWRTGKLFLSVEEKNKLQIKIHIPAKYWNSPSSLGWQSYQLPGKSECCRKALPLNFSPPLVRRTEFPLWQTESLCFPETVEMVVFPIKKKKKKF